VSRDAASPLETSSSSESPTPRPEPPWAEWTDEQLLALRFSELHVTIQGSVLEGRIAQLDEELEARGLRFRPHVWLSDEWFTPDGVSGVAIPFYLAHPRLERLEEAQMLEVEGGTHDWCMKILRHEAGHAFDNAFRLQRRRRRLQLFGRSSIEYPEYYTPKPYSKSFVLHLDMWYAQSHPDEDFAETFAVWLAPDSEWAKRYAEWPTVLRKLEYMDKLMRSLRGQKAPYGSRRLVQPVSRLKRTLGDHYRRKRAHYGIDYPEFYDRDLRRLFSDEPQYAGNLPAARFIARIRRDVRRRIARSTGLYQYTIDQVLEDMIVRARELKLRVKGPEDQARLDFTIALTVQTMNYLHSGRHRVAL
jgi:hypothetical protein